MHNLSGDIYSNLCVFDGEYDYYIVWVDQLIPGLFPTELDSFKKL